jgi:hypothetical protein
MYQLRDDRLGRLQMKLYKILGSVASNRAAKMMGKLRDGIKADKPVLWFICNLCCK